MSLRAGVGLAILWLLSLVVVGTVVSAQVRPFVPLPEPRVFSGADLGFRVDGRQGDTPVGSIVVKIDDKWVPVQEGGAPTIRR